MKTTIIQAIRHREVLELRYHGYSRLIEPHVYGTDKNGCEKLRCFQVGGGSVSNEPIDWKMLNVVEIDSVHPTGHNFLHARTEYNRDDPVIVTIYAQL